MTVIYEGNATKDSEVRFTPNGKAVASFGVAVNTRSKDQQGNYVDDPPLFVKVTVWGKPAEAVSESVRKGTRVIVAGRQRMTEWTTRDGETRQDLEVTADHVGLSLTFGPAQHVASRPAQPSGQGEQWNSQPPAAADPWGQTPY
ncbi:single-stranded DNA-binding protein [Brachybacterium alimentarium]|uniref:single-stranded DNA-binding protein n=1 Tax=Brachybacterium alimentarium TaxID=47845 RepID=UPI003FD4472D